MNLETLENKTILLFGQARAFSQEEFEAQLKVHSITLVKEFQEDISLIIDGRMMTPYDTNESERIYELKKYEFTAIDIFEKELAKHLDEDTLLMSLKLSNDKQRLKTFIANSTISDTLFVRLLKMYKWGEIDFFESDDNRDVSAALIRRYYKNIEQNHNLEYASLGIMHLIAQTHSSELISLISSLRPLRLNENMQAAIATHVNTQVSILEKFIKESSPYIKTLIAMREDLSKDMQEKLYQLGNADVNEALSYNANLDRSILLKLKDEPLYAKNIAQHIKLDAELFELFRADYPDVLAKNHSLTFDMQECLVTCHDRDVVLSLASNDAIDAKVITELLVEDMDDINMVLFENSSTPQDDLIKAYENKLNHFALSHNENTPQYILKLLAESGDMKVLFGLAANSSTPVDVLYQLQLDSKLAKVVKSNKAFLKNIKTENIGWQ